MSGLIHSSDLGGSGLSGGWRLFRFTGEANELGSNSAWIIPADKTLIYCEVIGGGGSGAGGYNANQEGGGGGGGGAFAWGMYSIAHMATAGITALNVTVGDEVAGGAAASNGNTGENSSIVGTASTSGYGNMTLSAFAGGSGSVANDVTGGGGGGGTGAIGADASGSTGGAGGKPTVTGRTASGNSSGGEGGYGGSGAVGGNAEYGGGGGGG